LVLEDSLDPPYNDAMTTDEKLTAILAAVQTDPGGRGLARDPHDNLFTACPGDFAAACRSIAEHANPGLLVVTGFFIPTGDSGSFETDGPLGTVFLLRAMAAISVFAAFTAEAPIANAIGACIPSPGVGMPATLPGPISHYVAVERAGPASDGNYYTMRGRTISPYMSRYEHLLASGKDHSTIGIGDGGNEIGMGKIPHGTIVKNIPNGDLTHCRVPTDHLIVAGVSNWGAYALAAGVYVLRGVKPPADLFDPNREREILEVMVREGPLVDGVTGKQTATVDGLSWEEYARPLLRIREIVGM
jgi:hypothetical protein